MVIVVSLQGLDEASPGRDPWPPRARSAYPSPAGAAPACLRVGHWKASSPDERKRLEVRLYGPLERRGHIPWEGDELVAARGRAAAAAPLAMPGRRRQPARAPPDGEGPLTPSLSRGEGSHDFLSPQVGRGQGEGGSLVILAMTLHPPPARPCRRPVAHRPRGRDPALLRHRVDHRLKHRFRSTAVPRENRASVASRLFRTPPVVLSSSTQLSDALPAGLNGLVVALNVMSLEAARLRRRAVARRLERRRRRAPRRTPT